MSKTLRVHNLAKELGIDSKEIIAKCQAEGIDDIKTHMSVVKLGLAESIREWFSAGADVTSVEAAAPVDLGKVKKRRSRKGKDEEDHADENGGVAVAEAPVAEVPIEHEAVAERPIAPPVVEEPAEIETSPAEEIAPAPAEVITPVVEAKPVVEVPAPPASPEVAPPPVKTVETEVRPPVVVEPPPPAKVEAPVRIPVPPPAVRPAIAAKHTPLPIPVPPTAPKGPPKPITRIASPQIVGKPAGPQVVPTPAALQGPRVVRIEAPDPVRAPRPRPQSFDSMPSGGSDRSGPPRGGRGPIGRGPGKVGESEAEALKKGTRSPRRHGRDTDVMVDERMREWKDQDVLERKERLAAATGGGLRARRSAERRRQAGQPAAAPVGKKGDVEITVPIMVKDFCAAVGTTYKVISQKLLAQSGKILRINDMLDGETAEFLALELAVPIQFVQAKTAFEKLEDQFANRERKHESRRPPVVCILGHVDHGKTSLLDAIRKTSVASGEAGGITQHIGAYRVDKGDWHVTFLDTPGHEAFTAMRARGANMTDVVVLVVAATDGVMPQTIEAMNHAKAAGVTIVVALNKIDVPGIDVNKVYGQLAEQELTPSEWGGTIDVVKTSAVNGQGVDELIGHLSTLSDLLDLKADPTVPASGSVIEAQMREGRGYVAQVLVREGTLKPGQVVVCGPASGRVRALIDDKGKRLDKAGPSTPVEILGLDDLPLAGDKLYVVDDISLAKDIAGEVKNQRRQESLQTVRKSSLEDLLREQGEDEVPELNIILKADVAGSLESLKKLLGDFPTDKAKLRILHSGVGQITEADVSLAQTSQAAIIGFNIIPEDRARMLAEQVGVQIRSYRVIYEIKDDLVNALEGLLEPDVQRQYRGKAEVLQVFNVSKAGTVAGCRVVDGIINRTCKLRLIRDGRIVVDSAEVGSLRRVKDDVREVRSGQECGIRIENFDDVKPGDVIEAFEAVEVRQKL